jgi:division protein CdvB (Snf7/Vps24/ESCRT-III family)
MAKSFKQLEKEFEEFEKKLQSVNDNIDEIMDKIEHTDDPELTIYMSGAVFARSAVLAEVSALQYLRRCLSLFREFGGEVNVEEMKAKVKEAMDKVTDESPCPDDDEGDKKWLH